jgi:hypothetical protein
MSCRDIDDDDDDDDDDNNNNYTISKVPKATYN